MVTLATDLDILNFSLAYEYLEFAQYQNVLRSGVLSGSDLALVTLFSQNEGQHIQLLTRAIMQFGGRPVQAQAAYNLPRITNRNDALLSLGLFCDTGASAYLGAAPLIRDKQVVLVTGVSLHNIEAEQAASLRDLVGLPPAPFTVAKGRTADEILAIIAPYMQAPNGTPVLLPPPPVALIQGTAVPAMTATGATPSAPTVATTPPVQATSLPPAPTRVPTSAPPSVPPATPTSTAVPPIIVPPVGGTTPNITAAPPIQPVFPIATGPTGLPEPPFTPRRVGNG